MSVCVLDATRLENKFKVTFFVSKFTLKGAIRLSKNIV